MNRDHDDPHEVTFDVSGFGPIDGRADLELITGPGLGANNEPESDICSHPQLGCPMTVETEYMHLDGVGTTFTYQIPKHAFAAIVLHRSDLDDEPPAQVPYVQPTLMDDSVRIAWGEVTDADLAGYNIYRSEIPGGPYGFRVAQTSAAVRTYVDPTALTGTDYYYAVAAYDAAGNEGPRSPAARYDSALALSSWGLGCSAVGGDAGAAEILATLMLLAAPLAAVRLRRMRELAWRTREVRRR